jgi:beta-glucosidase-like glycosyl hydrolase/CubicO group peptidase (beta-lactamase class C family)
MRKIFFPLIFFITLISVSFIPPGTLQEPVFHAADQRWVDSVMKVLTPEERLAQLFMVAAYSNRDKAHVKEIKDLIINHKIGGLIFFQGGPYRQAVMANTFQQSSKVPLFMAMDAEWGLAMRLDSTTKFPRQMTLGAIQDDSLVYRMGVEIARQCKRLGMQINFAPVVDVNNNPLNPVISSRSFGEDKYNVTRKSLMYMKGMQDNGVLANAKHFPGHGDTDSDSHKTLPTITASRGRLDTLELFPFRELFAQGLGSIMVAHLSIPSLDTTHNQASTLTKKIVTGLLKDTMGFKGLVFTDALNMKGVSKFYKPGEVDVKALIAGNDVLLFAEDVPTAMAEIKKAIERGEISQEEIDQRCRKVLMAKKWTGLDKYKPIRLKNIHKELNTLEAELLNRKLTEASLTLLQNNDSILPLRRPDTLRIASLSLGFKEQKVFQSTMAHYADVKHFGFDKEEKKKVSDTLLSELRKFDLVIVHVNNTNQKPDKDFGLTAQSLELLSNVMKQNKVILNISANPYVLGKLDSLHKAAAIIMSYEDNDYSGSYAAQLIFGGVAAKGKLPISAGIFKAGTGIETKTTRLRYSLPEDVKMNSKVLDRIDTIALKGIKDKVFPGCQVMVVKSGTVVYQRSFGYHTYANKDKVHNDDLYDIASVTKIAASTLSLMKLSDEKKVKVDDRLCYYLPELEGSNKQNIIIRNMMAHQAGLRDWIPFWMKTVDKAGGYVEGIYNKDPNDFYTKRVAQNLYINKNYEDTIYKQIIASPLKDTGKYVYSDLGYYFMKKIIEKETGMPLERYVASKFYAPLGLKTIGYRPRERFDLKRIVPTEFDAKFRRQLVHGDVHDQGAAMLGGVGGHAGLFSNAGDLAILLQMMVNNGTYGGERFIDSLTIHQFTKCQFCWENRRGIGFDKPEMTAGKDSPVCLCVPPESYGHAGFTGTLVWVDPVQDLVYVFLSNRVYPDAEDNKLAKSGIRGKIHQVLYDAMKPVK